MAVCTGDVELCFKAAEGFYNTALTCEEDDGDVVIKEGFKYPYVTNIIFACELMLKCIQMIESPNSEFNKGHKLKKLYEGLKNRSQEEINKMYIKETRHANIDRVLNNLNNVYNKWRYAFSEASLVINASDMKKLYKVLKWYVQKQNAYTYRRSVPEDSN